VSSLTIPYLRTEFGYKLPMPTRPAVYEAHSSPEVKAELVAPKLGVRDLLLTEAYEIRHRLKDVSSAINSLERQRDAVEDMRLSLRALTAFVVVGVWNRTTSWLRWSSSEASATAQKRAIALDRDISEKVGQIKRITERVVMSAAAPIREDFRGRTFTKDADTPKELLLISVPTEKAGKILSFDSLRMTIDTRALGAKTKCDISRGEGRIILERVKDGMIEQLELAFKRAGKVDVYVNGERRGSMWNDDALDLSDAFVAGRAIPLEKRKKSDQYTVC
jgi:hypothetical protein